MLRLTWKLHSRGPIIFLSVEAEVLELLESLLSDVETPHQKAVTTDTKCAVPVTGKKLSKQVI